MGVRVKWHGEKVMAAIQAEITKRVRRVIEEVRRQVVKNISTSARRGSRQSREGHSLPGEFPRAVRGILRNSIFSDLSSPTSGIIGVDAGTPAKKYARRLEEGGVITSHGKRMAIPISWAARKHSLSNQGPLTFPKKLVKINRKGKTSLLVEIPPAALRGRESKKAWIIHYVLSPKATIAARPFLSRTVTEMEPRIKQIFEEQIKL